MNMTTQANPFKAGSRKAAIYDAFVAAGGADKGLKAAYAKAKELEIKEGTVKSWAGSWTKGTLPKPKGPKVARERKDDTTEAKDKDYNVHFKYTTKAQAESAKEDLCERAGLRPHAFHILEQEGRFALCPIHYRPIGPIPTFKKGDVVFDAYIINSKARVIEPGPEQSLIKFDLDAKPPFHHRPREQLTLNRYLVKLPDEPLGKPVREKLKPQRERLETKPVEFKESNAKKALRKEAAKLVTPGGKKKKVAEQPKKKVKRVK
jgi:hypothetical protein